MVYLCDVGGHFNPLPRKEGDRKALYIPMRRMLFQSTPS